MPARASASAAKPKTAIIAYVPALHAGYKRLFDVAPDATIYVLGPEIIARFDQLRKELRALAPADAVAGIAGWGRTAAVLTPELLAELAAARDTQISMPDEDVSHELAQEYFGARKVWFEPIFLRWDRRKMEATSDPVNPDRTISTEAAHRELIVEAVRVGRASSNLWRRMGALIVRDGRVVLSAYNHSHPTPHTSWIDGDPRNNANRGVSIDLTTDIHAEAGVIAEAARRGLALEGTAMYVLDFPCPSCAKLIANSGITRLYYGKGYAVLDGEQALQASGVELVHVTDVEGDEGGHAPDGTDNAVWVPYPEKPAK